MNVETRIKIDFTEKERKAIQTLIEMTDEFSKLCENCDCIRCPLTPFCYALDSIDRKIDLFKNNLTEYLNGEN